jgi:5'-nucleotidase
MSNESPINSRRKFLIQAAGLTVMAGVSGIPLIADAKPKIRKLTILHTNDTHSQIDPIADNDPQFPGLGGIARRAEIIKKIRREEENVLLLDSGDIYQGTPYFNFYGGSIEFKLMSELGYDASTMGNHDFDIGMDGFLRNLPFAKFPFLCSNYDFKNTMLEGKTQPYKIFEKQGARIGIFGLGVKLQGLVLEKLYGETQYLDPVEIANDMARQLKVEKKCHYVICLSHLGYNYEKNICDTKLAQQTKHLDLILGGHSHTFLDKPVPYRNLDGKEVFVAQTGKSGIRLGRIDIVFNQLTGTAQMSRTNQIQVT